MNKVSIPVANAATQGELNFSAKPIKHIAQRATSRDHWHKYEATGQPQTQSDYAHAIIKLHGPITARMVNQRLRQDYNMIIDQSTCARAINTLLNMENPPIKIFKREPCPITDVRVHWYVTNDYKEPIKRGGTNAA